MRCLASDMKRVWHWEGFKHGIAEIFYSILNLRNTWNVRWLLQLERLEELGQYCFPNWLTVQRKLLTWKSDDNFGEHKVMIISEVMS